MHATKTTFEQLSHERFILCPYEMQCVWRSLRDDHQSLAARIAHDPNGPVSRLERPLGKWCQDTSTVSWARFPGWATRRSPCPLAKLKQTGPAGRRKPRGDRNLFDVRKLEDASKHLGDAVLNPLIWRELMEDICQAVDARGAAMLQSDVRTEDIPRTAAVSEFFDNYFHHKLHVADVRAAFRFFRRALTWLRMPTCSDRKPRCCAIRFTQISLDMD